MKISLGNTVIWTAGSTIIKMLAGLFVLKLIAIYFGTEGVGRAANYMTLLTILGAFSGAGIFNGVTKYVAEYENDPIKLTNLLTTSCFIVLIFSSCLAILGMFFADIIAQFIFADTGYQTVIRVLAILQCGIAFSNYFLAIFKGQRDVKSTVLSTIIGILLGLILFVIMLYFYQYQGALIGLALIPAVIVLPAFYFLRQKCGQNLLSFHSNKDHKYIRNLLKFSLMTLVTIITIPLTYILMRNWLIEARSIHEVGLWQGVNKISDIYLQFITIAYSIYLLPTFAKLKDKRVISKEIINALKWVFPVILTIIIVIYALRPLVIYLLFSHEFLAMKELFLWQLIGDLFKVSSYIFSYLIIAKAILYIYIIAEVIQCSLLLGLASYLIPINGAVGAVQSYMLTYILYFTLCVAVFLFYLKKD